jgi:hypothetical protein
MSRPDDPQQQEALEQQYLLEGPGAVELTVLAFPLWCGGDQLNWPPVVRTVARIGADVVALGGECEGHLQKLADACGYPFVDRKRNVMAKFPLFDSASTAEANSPASSPQHGAGSSSGGGVCGGGLIGSGGYSPGANGFSDGFSAGLGPDGLGDRFGDAHLWAMVAPGRVVALALLPASSLEGRPLDNDACEGGSVALRGLARLAAHGVPVFLCTAAVASHGRPSGSGSPQAAAAERASPLWRLTPPASPCSSRNGDSSITSSTPTSRHVIASSGFRDSYAETHAGAASDATNDANADGAGAVRSANFAPSSCAPLVGRVACTLAPAAGLAPAAAGTAVHGLLVAGPTRTLRCDSFDASVNNQSSSISGRGGDGGGHGLLAGCRAVASSFRALPAASPPVVVVEPSVALEGDDFCVRPFDPSSDGWWVEVRTASRHKSRYSTRRSPSNSGNLPSSALLNNSGLSGSGLIGGVIGGGFTGACAAGVAVLSWREERGERLCARFAGGLGAGCYDAVLLDSRTGADLATARFQVTTTRARAGCSLFLSLSEVNVCVSLWWSALVLAMSNAPPATHHISFPFHFIASMWDFYIRVYAYGLFFNALAPHSPDISFYLISVCNICMCIYIYRFFVAPLFFRRS